MEKTNFPVPRQYKSITYGVRRTNENLPDNILIFERCAFEESAFVFHQQSRFALIYCIEGKGTVCLDEERFAFKRGNLILIFPWQQHCYRNVKTPIRWFFITADWMPQKDLYSLRNHLFRLQKDEQQLLKTMITVWNECEQQMEAWKADYMSGLLITLICGCRKRMPLEIAKTEVSADSYGLIDRINQYIYDHLRTSFNIKMIAEALGYSPNYLGAVFKKMFFLTLEQYIKNIRIDRAKSLLSGTDQSIGEIAQQVGFSSIYSFSNSFRICTGCSPSKYRKQCRWISIRYDQ